MISRFAVRHPVTVTMLVVGGLLLGGLSLRELPVDLLPEVEAPRIAVLLRSGDRPPEVLEDRYSKFMEAGLATLPGVASVRTLTSTGRVLATVEFDWDTEMDFALLDVQKQVAAFGTDPDVDSVTVRRFDPSAEPIVVVGMKATASGVQDLDLLRRLAEDRVARALERVPGVASVQVAGGRQRQVRVTVERHRLVAHGLDIGQVINRISQASADASGGTIEDRGRVHVIKGLGRFESLQDVVEVDLPVSSAERPGRPLRVGEVAEVAWADAPVRGEVLVDGTEGVSLSIFKEEGSNTVQVSDLIHRAVERQRVEVRDVELVVVRDQAGFIRLAIRQVETSAVIGGLLAVAVLLLFLRSLRAVVLVSVAIPISVVVTFALMSAADLTLNLMTLGGLALGVGMLIDNAIVVLEAIFRRLEDGVAPDEAAAVGASEVAGAILAATLTTCVVFLPVVFLHGVAAELFTDLAFTVAFSLVCSLGVALLVIPAAAARLFRGARGVRGARTGGAYEASLRGALRRPFTVLFAVALLVGGSIVLVPRLGLEFLPSSDPGEVTARMLLPEGTRVTVTREAAERLEEALRASVPGDVESTLSELGEAVREETAITNDIPSENTGVLRVRLRRERSVTTEQVMALLEEAGRQVAGLSLRFDSTDAVLGRIVESGPPIRLAVRGQELDAVEEGTERLAASLRDEPDLFNVRSSFEDRRAEVRLVIDRPVASGLGLGPDEIGRQLRHYLGAESATTFRLDGEDRDVVVRADDLTLGRLGRLILDSPKGGPVRLGDVASIDVLTSPTVIERTLGTRTGSVTAQVAVGSTLGDASRRVESAMRATSLPPGVRVELEGAETARRSSFGELLFAIGLAVVLVYMVMASLFESLVHPFTILFTLPTAGVGVIVALFASDTPFSVPSLLGIVMLAGIAVNNGILLVDLTGRLRRVVPSRAEAVVQAACQRVRPILMTSLTTVLAMLPLAIGWGEGADLRAPMAIAVVGGLVASTLLTLFLVPVAYELLDRLRPASRRESPAARPADDAATSAAAP